MNYHDLLKEVFPSIIVEKILQYFYQFGYETKIVFDRFTLSPGAHLSAPPTHIRSTRICVHYRVKWNEEDIPENRIYENKLRKLS